MKNIVSIKTNSLLMTITALGLGLSVVGCATRITDFTLLSTKNIDLAKASNFKRASNRAVGEDKVFILIFIPFGQPHVKDAVDNALKDVPGAIALVDGVVRTKGWWFIFGESGIVVEGTPLIDPSLASADLPSNHMISHYDSKTKRFQLDYVTAESFAAMQGAVATGNSKQAEVLLQDSSH